MGTGVVEEVSKEALGRLQTETQKAATRNKHVTLGAFLVYAVLVGGSVALLPAAFTESALVAARKAVVPHWCGFAGFLTTFSVELVSFLISTDAAKTRVMVITLGCSLMGAITYLLVATEVAPVMLGPASGFPVYPTKMLTWVCSTSLMIYVVWNSGDTPFSHLMKTLAYNTAMLIAGLIGFTSSAAYVPVAFACGVAMFCGMGYCQWQMIGLDTDDNNIETHRANMAIMRVKCIMAGCWLLFPVTYGLQFFNLVPHVALESAMVFIDVLSKGILMSAIQQGLLCTSADRKQALMQQMALDLVEDLKEADKRKDRFLATMTHELRTPLNGIVGITDALLLNFSQTLDERVVKGIQTVRDSGKRFSQLVANVLDSASISESKLRLILKPVTLAKIVDEVALLIEPLLRNNTKLLVNVPTSLPEVDADYDRLLQIMFNLMGNACKFTDDGEISVTATSAGGMMRIEVKDSGAGIDPEKHKIIFKAFEQGDNSRTRAHGGTGLGLSLARSLVEAHDGALTVRSELKKGSTFTVLIPLKAKVKETKTGVIGGTTKLDKNPPESTVVKGSNPQAPSSKSNPAEEAMAIDASEIGESICSSTQRKSTASRSAPSSRRSTKLRLMRQRRQSSFTTVSQGNLDSILRSGFRSRSARKSGGILGDWLEGRDQEAVSTLIRTELSDDTVIREILVVDDETINQYLMKELLQEVGFMVTQAASGQEAINILTDRYKNGGTSAFPELCLMDLMMPGLSGQDTVYALRSTFPDHRMPIIMLSAVDDEPTMVQALKNGCVDYICKPFKSGEFLARVALQIQKLQEGAADLEADLLRMLWEEFFPQAVVDRLATGQTLVSDVFESASVISIGVASFDSDIYTKQGASDVVSAVDDLLSTVDKQAKEQGFQSGLGGSLYTLVIGHEVSSSVDHASRAVQFAQDIAVTAAELSIAKGVSVKLRIGVDSGVAIAGVAGSRPPRYLLAGSTVDLSSKLESTCRPTCIQVSGATHKLVHGTVAANEVEFHKLSSPFQSDDGTTVETYLMDVGEWIKALRENARVSSPPTPTPLGAQTSNRDNQVISLASDTSAAPPDGVSAGSQPSATNTPLENSTIGSEQHSDEAAELPVDATTPNSSAYNNMGERRLSVQESHTRSGSGIFSCFSPPSAV